MRNMASDSLLRAWMALIALSGGSAVVSMLVGSGLNRSLAGTAILLLALLKSRVILSRYLGLWQAPSWLRGFSITLSFFAMLLLGLYLVPNLMG